MAKNKKNTSGEGLENVENAFSKTEQFLEKNQKLLMGIVLGILIIVGGYWAYQKFYKKPMVLEAQSQIFVAEQYFEADSFKIALNGDGMYPGFVEIVEDYSKTKVGHLAKYYVGISYLNIGDFDKAIEYLSEFKTKDPLLASISKGAIGDAYVEKEEYDNAIEFYIQATEKNENNFTTPIYLKKLGLVYEEKGENEKALVVYENILNNYSKSQEATSIEKYIARTKTKVGQ